MRIAVKLSVQAAVVALLVAGCGGPLDAEQETTTATEKSGICISPVYWVVHYGEMGYTDGCNNLAYCDYGLTPHNVDSYNNYVRAEDGWFSCWYNIPDVICHSAPQINGYINVRRDWVRPDGSGTETYGCTLGW